jgi:hypothetical protein
MSYLETWVDDDAGGGGPGDTAPPVIVKDSPTDFDTDPGVAATEPIVIDITDETGLSFFAITRGATLVYSGTGVSGSFQPGYSASSITPVVGGYRLSVVPVPSWGSGTVTLVVSAVDTGGNLTTVTVSLPLPPGAESGLPGFFRDNVWRWRRRLNRQKCSVISVAIDDRYAPNAGFTLTAISVEAGRKRGMDRAPWRGGGYTNSSGSGTSGNGR